MVWINLVAEIRAPMSLGLSGTLGTEPEPELEEHERQQLVHCVAQGRPRESRRFTGEAISSNQACHSQRCSNQAGRRKQAISSNHKG